MGEEGRGHGVRLDSTGGRTSFLMLQKGEDRAQDSPTWAPLATEPLVVGLTPARPECVQGPQVKP